MCFDGAELQGQHIQAEEAGLMVSALPLQMCQLKPFVGVSNNTVWVVCVKQMQNSVLQHGCTHEVAVFVEPGVGSLSNVRTARTYCSGACCTRLE